MQTFDYDRFGNRTVNQSQTAGAPATQFELSPQTNQEVAEPSNRLYAPGDAGRAPTQKLMRYDAVGNLVYDSYTGQGARVYDAESRMTQAQDVYQQWSTYTYDADGRRIKRLSANQETWQVYGIGGELLAEYRSGSAPMTATKEYGYRGGELLVTMSSGDDQRLKRFVTNLYYGALQRDPTAQELQDASNQLAAAGAQGQPQLLGKAKQVARALFTQTAYETSPARTDSQYVADLYYAYLQRAADDSGLSWWVSQVASKGRSGVCDDFQNSVEFDVLVTTLYGNAQSDNQRTEQFVNNFYLGAYGRFPTATELQQQRDALNAAAAQGQTQVQAQAETMGRALFAAQVTDLSIPAQQFVTNLYEGFLQRGPDSGGLSFWTTQAGTTAAGRQNVLTAFATCGPFRELSGTLYRETFWLVADHLGTPRMVVDKSGSLAGIMRHDYLPFGGDIPVGSGGRSVQQGYSDTDNVRQKFTAYERDTETALDYAQARYFASAQGRFTSTDPLLSSGRAEIPQSWNRFSYTLNNPLKYSDPLGMFEWFDAENKSKKENERREKFLKAYGKLKGLRDKALQKLGGTSEEYKKLNKIIETLGEPGDGNNVRIAFGETTSDDAAAETDGPITDFSTSKSYDKKNDYYKVTFDLGETGAGDSLVEAIGHEGQHVVDLKAGLRKNGGYNTYPLEFNGFEVSSIIQEAQGASRTYAGGGGKVWQQEWANLDRQTIQVNRKDAVNKFLSTNKLYKKFASPPK